MKLILLGTPGAGKGTQAEVLSKQLGIPTVSTGNIIRNAIRNQTDLGLQAKSFVDSGGLVPDTIVVSMLQEYLLQNDCSDGYILDGFPRNVQQAQTLEDMGILIDQVVNLCGRRDNPAAAGRPNNMSGLRKQLPRCEQAAGTGRYLRQLRR